MIFIAAVERCPRFDMVSPPRVVPASEDTTCSGAQHVFGLLPARGHMVEPRS